MVALKKKRRARVQKIELKFGKNQQEKRHSAKKFCGCYCAGNRMVIAVPRLILDLMDISPR
jgi:hypothetical protein